MTQDTALSLLRAGYSIFLTGEAGSGKTHTINEYTKYLRSKRIPFAVTASTGIAATHISGMTIHSWSGIGTSRTLDETEIKNIAKAAHVAKRIRKSAVLIIDEVSMLDGRVLTLIETVCRVVRKSSLPFGGMQVILVGDFFQLPPVTKAGDKAEYAFESEAWSRLVPIVCYLHEQFRQEDEEYLRLLKAIRENSLEEGDYEALRSQMVSEEEAPLGITRLYAHNVDVDRINQEELRQLPGKKMAYQMQSKGKDALVETLKRNCLSPERLELKVGALVMFTKNNQSSGYVNGTQGVVMSFDAESKLPLVKTRSGNVVEVLPMEWSMFEGEEALAVVTQLPLRLAWAMTIHKSQGTSLDAAVIDLSKTFEYGQGYVALSRVRTLRGLHLLGMNQRATEMHPEIRAVDQEFKQSSDEAGQKHEHLDTDTIERLEANFIIVSGGKNIE
jgi:ATP-dependent exoDNAse (exonuclease V) alpha subunit